MNYSASIQAAIDFIESRLFEDIAPSAVAAQIGFSEYHFHRIFRGMLRESVADYIRKRRISEAAKLLQESDKPILELALASGFETHESFTRAFKKMYGLTPSQYRQQKHGLSTYHKKRTSRTMLEHIQTGITLEPRIETRGPELVVGLGAAYSEGAESSFLEIQQLWKSFLTRQAEIARVKPGYALGVCLSEHVDIPKRQDRSFAYIAGLPVSEFSDIPPGMVTCAIQKSKYAVFTHKGSLSALPHTVNYIWGTWIPKNVSNYSHANAPDFELYDSRFDPETDSGEFDIYVPILQP